MFYLKTAVVCLLLSGCTAKTPSTNRPIVNLDPLGCGYRWFQTGYSEYVSIQCDVDRRHLQDEQTKLAEQHAWHVAQQRCPSVCPPIIQKDTVEWENHMAEGVCRDNQVYFVTRKFFACGKPD